MQKLTVGYTPISRRRCPFFIAVEDRLFQKYGFEVSPVFMGGSPLIELGDPRREFSDWLHRWWRDHLKPSLGQRSDRHCVPAAGAHHRRVVTAGDQVDQRFARKKNRVTRFGASTHFAGLSMLESAGIKPNEVVFIQNGGVGESLAALLGGRVDASMIGFPFGLKAKNAGFNMLFRPTQTDYGLFPTAVIAARESWIKEPKGHRIAVDFLRALNEGLHLARDNAAVTKRALKKYTRVDDDAALQGSYEFFREAFPTTLRVPEKAMANALKFIDHPKAKQYDVTQSFDNSLVSEAMKQ